MGIGAGLYMYVVVVQKFTFAISSPDECLYFLVTSQEIGWEQHLRNDLCCVEWAVKALDHLFDILVLLVIGRRLVGSDDQ